MVVMHVVGNRPQFIKLAPVSRELRRRDIKEIIIHTGQHYDENMSDIFFDELGIPKPDRNLNVGSGTHAEITAKAMLELEKVMLELEPNVVLVYGDTNSTLAAALVASKLHIPIVHIEAGPRTQDKKNPEECNRIVVDHLSDILCTPDRNSFENLIKEGIPENKAFFTGDVMYDEFLYCADNLQSRNDVIKGLDKYILFTWHRQENTNSKERMSLMIDFIEAIKNPIIFPMHPRTQKMLQRYELWDRITDINHLTIIDPVGYMEMVGLIKECQLVISDSGGASKEASFVGKKCIYTLNLSVWPELEKEGYISHVDIETRSSVEAALDLIDKINFSGLGMKSSECFGSGDAAKKIADIIVNFSEWSRV